MILHELCRMSDSDDRDDSSRAEDPLDDVFVDDTSPDKHLLASILEPYVTIGQSNGKFQPKPAYEKLNSAGKVLVTLVAQQAKVVRGVAESASLGPSDISNQSGVKVNTVKPKVRELAEEGIIHDGDDGYSAEPLQLQRIADRLSPNE